MPGTVKIWWHDGAVRDVRYHDIPVASEPELGYESVNVSTTPVSSGPAPANAVVAIVECDVNVRYSVQRQGLGAPADPVASKPIAATGHATDTIGIQPGDTISLIEA